MIHNFKLVLNTNLIQIQTVVNQIYPRIIAHHLTSLIAIILALNLAPLTVHIIYIPHQTQNEGFLEKE